MHFWAPSQWDKMCIWASKNQISMKKWVKIFTFVFFDLETVFGQNALNVSSFHFWLSPLKGLYCWNLFCPNAFSWSKEIVRDAMLGIRLGRKVTQKRNILGNPPRISKRIVLAIAAPVTLWPSSPIMGYKAHYWKDGLARLCFLLQKEGSVVGSL